MKQPEWKWQAGAGILVFGVGLVVASWGRPLHVSDLSLVGLVLDLVGAYYLGRGLIVEPRRNVERAATRFGLSPHTILGVAEDKVDGRLGIAWLVFGFGLQVVAYLLQLGEIGPGATGERTEVAAIGLALMAGAAAYLTTAVLRPRLLRRELREIAGMPGLRGEFEISEASLLNVFAHLITGTHMSGRHDEALVEQVFGDGIDHSDLTI